MQSLLLKEKTVEQVLDDADKAQKGVGAWRSRPAHGWAGPRVRRSARARPATSSCCRRSLLIGALHAAARSSRASSSASRAGTASARDTPVGRAGATTERVIGDDDLLGVAAERRRLRADRVRRSATPCRWAMAVAVNATPRGATFYRIAYYLPGVFSVVVVGMMFAWILQPSVGILNRTPGRDRPGGAQAPLAEPTRARRCRASAAVYVWYHWGFGFLLFLAGLQAIPRELYEAAAIDGAGAWQRFRYVTWPQLTPVTTIVEHPDPAGRAPDLRHGPGADQRRPRLPHRGADAPDLQGGVPVQPLRAWPRRCRWCSARSWSCSRARPDLARAAGSARRSTEMARPHPGRPPRPLPRPGGAVGSLARACSGGRPTTALLRRGRVHRPVPDRLAAAAGRSRRLQELYGGVTFWPAHAAVPELRDRLDRGRLPALPARTASLYSLGDRRRHPARRRAWPATRWRGSSSPAARR